VVHLAEGQNSIGLEPLKIGSDCRGPIKFQTIQWKDYHEQVKPMLLDRNGLPRQDLMRPEVHYVSGEVKIGLEYGYVELREATVAYFQRKGRKYWQAEMEVKELVWYDPSREQTELDHTDQSALKEVASQTGQVERFDGPYFAQTVLPLDMN
jgi:hypothetical protein